MTIKKFNAIKLYYMYIRILKKNVPLLDLSQEDPIPLFVDGQDLLTQIILISDGVTETHHFRPSNLHAWKLYGHPEG